MKKVVTHSNPFILLLAPVLFALIMGISYQFEQRTQEFTAAHTTATQAKSLFVKGISLIQAVCAVAKENVW